MLFLLLLTTSSFGQQAEIFGQIVGQVKARIAAADFKAASADANAFDQTFNTALWGDLDQAGIFDLVSKSLYPTAPLGSPQDLGQSGLAAWASPPPNVNMLALGNLGVANGQLAVFGWLLDTKNPTAPPVVAKEYHEQATDDNARLIAHRFADAIIQRLGGEPGIAESKIYFISNRTGFKELWVMDYDGSNQRQLTHLNSIALSPAVSPDGTRVAFVSWARGKTDIAMFSTELGRVVSFPRWPGTNSAPAWSPDGTKLAFSSSMPGDPEIYIVDASGNSQPRRVTAYHGPDTQPVWNPKTGAQIIWVSGRGGSADHSIPQLYEMDQDGTNVQKLTDGGYAVSPAWSPNGMFIAFSWDRHYGPGAPGAPDIYAMDAANPSKWIQLTHNAGRNDYPTWAADGRHIAYQSKQGRCEQIWSMLGDGSKARQLTHQGCNTQPSWSH